MMVKQTGRVKGWAPWKPQRRTEVVLEAVDEVLDEYSDHLPLTIRQVFYRLVGAHGYDKTEAAYERLTTYLTRARRSGRISCNAIRDDGATVDAPDGFDGLPDFWSTVETWAQDYRRDRRAGQHDRLEVWCEAAGMVPQLARVAEEYGVPVYSSSGFDSLTVKVEAARRAVRWARDHGGSLIVLHIGDHDPSGVHIFTSLVEDVKQLSAGHFDGRRVAVTPEQAAEEEYDLPSTPPKVTDKRSFDGDETWQAEALPPDALASILTAAIEEWTDAEVLAEVVAQEEAERAELMDELDGRAS